MTDIVQPLPSSWVMSELGTVADVNPRLSKSDYADAMEVSFVPMPAVGAGTGTIDVSETRRFGDVKKGYTAFSEGDVLFAKITPCMENGKMAVAPVLKNGLGFGSTEFHVLRSGPEVAPRYLYYFVSAQRFRYDAEHNMTGAVGQRRVPTSYISEHPIPLPPSAEQHRIITTIEQLFSELDKGTENLTTAREQLMVYRQAVLNQAASGQLLVSRGVAAAQFGDHSLASLADIVLELGQGWSPRCLNHPTADESLWGVIKTTAIQHGAFDESAHKQLPDNLEPRPHLCIASGDILVTRAGPRKRVGVACLVRECRPRLMLCDKAYRLRANEQKVIPAYLEMLLNSPKVLQDVEQLKTGINDSGVNLTQEGFLALKVHVPPLELQRRTLDELEAVMSQIDHLTAQIENSLTRAETLRQGILERAFCGELVAQDPSEEPASVLLERIKAEKETDKKKTGRKAAA